MPNRTDLTTPWMSMRRHPRILAAVTILSAGLALSACKLKNAEPGPLTGPSVLGTSLTITATPNALTKDGRSTSTIVITARGPNGEPLGSLVAKVEICTEFDTNGDSIADCFDLGRLSVRRIVTDGGGRATLTYTAPRDTGSPLDIENVAAGVSIFVTPEGADATSTIPREVTIRLLPLGGAPPPQPAPTTPVASFTVGATPTAAVPVEFDASGSLDAEGATGNSTLIDYRWDFGDTVFGKGEVTTHTYDAPGTFIVKLTVSNGVLSDTATQTVIVVASANPVAAFTFTPTAPDVDETTFFNAVTSTAATGREIVGYDWSFSDGASAVGVTTSREFDTPGDFETTLTVRDDIGNLGVTSSTLTVGAGDPTASIVHSPDEPAAGAVVNFDASGSTASGGATIVRYEWNFGDDSSDQFVTRAFPDVQHVFASAGDFVVTLVVTDSEGRTATATDTLTVAP